VTSLGGRPEELFVIALEHLSDVELSVCRDLDPEELGDVASITQAMCRGLAGHVRFVVRAFDDREWPVDVKTDLSVFVEQLPKLLEFLASETRGSCLVDFYEQGIERALEFRQDGEAVVVTCSSRTRWRPQNDRIVLDGRSLVRMLGNLLSTFLDAGQKACSEGAAQPAFVNWRADVLATKSAMDRRWGL
jgi:hypothetical protein